MTLSGEFQSFQQIDLFLRSTTHKQSAIFCLKILANVNKVSKARLEGGPNGWVQSLKFFELFSLYQVSRTSVVVVDRMMISVNRRMDHVRNMIYITWKGPLNGNINAWALGCLIEP